MWRTRKATFAPKQDATPKILKELTLTIPSGMKNIKDKIIKLYSYTEKYILVPRFYANVRCELPTGPEYRFTAPKLYSENQQIVVNELTSQMREPTGRTLIMATGQGKTYVGLKMIEVLARRTLIVCHNCEIARTWETLVTNCLPHPEQAGKWGDGTKIKASVTVGIIHTLIKEPHTWFDDFDFIIYDEITEFLSDTRRKIFELAARPWILALTATPHVERRRIFELHCGPYVWSEKLTGFNKLEIPWKVNVKVLKYFGPEQYTQRLTSTQGTTHVVLMDKQFATDPHRNEMIITQIQWLRGMEKQVFVFYSICELGLELEKQLKIAVNPEEIAVLTGQYKSHEMQEIIDTKKIILTTYKFSAKGISIPKMDAIVLATPQISNTEQIIGRILRIGGNYQSERWIVDIVDSRTTLKSQFYERKKFYQRENFTMMISKVQVKN